MDVSFTFPSSAIVLAEVSRKAVSLLGGERESFWHFVTNSCFVAAIVTGIIIWMANKATSKMTLIPHPWQNFFESIIEAVYNQVEAIVGPKQAPRAFPLLATLFIFILVSNYFGLLPGVGTIGWGHGHGMFSLDHITAPLLRPATADLNMTLGMALCFMLIWLYLTIRELGVWGFIKHTFGPKGGAKGLMGVFIALVFLLVGAIEIVSIMFRPGSLSLRLFGNIYAGETLLHTMMTLGDMFGLGSVGKFIIATIAPIPFYFMELLVGLLQAAVFTLLCAVYIQLSTTHDEHHDEGHDHDHH
ncbi:F-type H+-transporting ATPase subunit a [Prosthecobacter fusiformis]|uniref:ATP synthase subunit a n=1 Tax=Prosthecobacter fusiformis TaxID=48464 RepID=A0A4R7RK74_9BACT|nr:F0F1 ATP synthase subunit A [Prosthecobacter fusiformis]TDU64597.1 F-type H+-transporting ATPase subunit a [Prosthecobacter fusiformis]